MSTARRDESGIVVAGLAEPDQGPPRGVRNNNPGNLRWVAANDWRGQTGSDADPPENGFAVFSAMRWGARAMCHLIFIGPGYFRSGRNTIRKIITRYAPRADGNDVPAYVAAVAATTGWSADASITPSQSDAFTLLRAMMIVELGASWVGVAAGITDDQIRNGIALAWGTGGSAEPPDDTDPSAPDRAVYATVASPVRISRVSTVASTATPSFSDRASRDRLLPDPEVGQLSYISGENITYVCSQSAAGRAAVWEPISAEAGGSEPADGSITIVKLVGGATALDGQVLTAAVDTSSRRLKWTDPATAELANRSVTAEKLAPLLTGAPRPLGVLHLAAAGDQPPASETWGLSWALISAADIADAAVGTDQIAARAVTRDKVALHTLDATTLADDAVQAAALADTAVLPTKIKVRPQDATTHGLKDGRVLSVQSHQVDQVGTVWSWRFVDPGGGGAIPDKSITAAKLVSGAADDDHNKWMRFGLKSKVNPDDPDVFDLSWVEIAFDHLAGRISEAQLPDGAWITTGMIGQDQVTNPDIAPGAITAVELQAGGSSSDAGKVLGFVESGPPDAKVYKLQWVANGSGSAAVNTRGAIVGDGTAAKPVEVRSAGITAAMLSAGDAAGDVNKVLTLKLVSSDPVATYGLAWTALSAGGGISSVAATAPLTASIVGSELRMALTGRIAATNLPNSRFVGQAQLADDAVGTRAIADHAVTVAKLPSGAAAGTYLDGNGTWKTVPSGGGGISTVKTTAPVTGNGVSIPIGIISRGISSAYIANSAVGTSQLAGNAVTSNKILANNVIGSKIASNAIINRHLASGQVRPTTCDQASSSASSNFYNDVGQNSARRRFYYRRASTFARVWDPSLEAWHHTLVSGEAIDAGERVVVDTPHGKRAATVTAHPRDGDGIEVHWHDGDEPVPARIR